MHRINEVTPDYEPRKRIFAKLPKDIGKVEMSENQSAFLCGLLKEKKPSKLLEVGVAAGGTTAVLLECMEEIGNAYSLYSVDVSREYYRQKDKRTGFIGDMAKEILKPNDTKMLLGGGIA